MTDTFPTAADEPETATIDASTFLSVAGDGPPGTDDFYARKAELRAAAERLGHTGPIEILYWFGHEHGDVDIAGFYWTLPLEHLQWRMLVRVPDDTELPADLAASGLSLFPYTEGKVVQVMHHGSFAGEDKTMARLGAFADSLGLRRSGPHTTRSTSTPSTAAHHRTTSGPSCATPSREGKPSCPPYSPQPPELFDNRPGRVRLTPMRPTTTPMITVTAWTTVDSS